jgi:hypothetical protein
MRLCHKIRVSGLNVTTVVILGKVVAYKNINVFDKEDLPEVDNQLRLPKDAATFNRAKLEEQLTRIPVISLPSAVVVAFSAAGTSPPAITPASASVSDKATYYQMRFSSHISFLLSQQFIFS